MKLIIFTGVPGSGKSTISKKVSRALNIDRISMDEVQVKEFEAHGFSSNEEKNRIVKKSQQKVIEYINKSIEQNSDIIVDKFLKDSLFIDALNIGDNVDLIIFSLIADFDAIAFRYNNRGTKERPECMEVINQFPIVEGVSKKWPPITNLRVKELFSLVNIDKYNKFKNNIDANGTIEETVCKVLNILKGK